MTIYIRKWKTDDRWDVRIKTAAREDVGNGKENDWEWDLWMWKWPTPREMEAQ